MDASQLTAYRRAHSQFMYYEQQTRRGPQDQANLQTGAPSFFLNGRVIVQSGIPSEIPVIYSYSMNNSILQAFETFLQWIVTKGLGPTATARVLYLWFMTVAAPWNWVSIQNKLSGTHDTWNFDQRTLLSEDMKVFIWTNHAMVDTFATLFPGYDISYILTQERSNFRWTQQQQQDAITNIRTEGNWPAFWTAWQTWAAYRIGDGSATYLTQQPTTSEVVNLDIQMNVYNTPTIPDYSAPHDATKWTPLYNNITNKKQGYLTYFWDSVTSTGITSSQEVGMDNVADQYYVVGQQRVDELNDVMNITATLNDSGKITAEFWAGGPNTVTPPGMMGWFWKEYVRTNTVDTPTLIFSGLDVGIHLFEGSRITWRIKANKVQARPIQELRILHNGQTIASWNGSVAGETWVPYQEDFFVTPPFADFPSGHSHFSQGFANTMTAWFGQNMPTAPITKSDLTLLSPIFNGTGSQTNALNTITVSTGKSVIQPGIVPAAPTSLTWTTWQDMADSAGMSRLYGGIHCTSANTSSQAVANQLHTDLNTVWGFNRN
jgi:hypothetical protein